MMGVLAPAAPKLAPLIRLLASDVDGEVIAATRGLRRVLSSAGADLNDLADLVERSATTARPRQTTPDDAAAWEELARRYLNVGTEILGPRDLEFLVNVLNAARIGRAPSAKQRKWLDDIAEKLEAKL